MSSGGTAPPVSPFVYTAADYQGHVLSVTCVFNNGTLALISVTTLRDPACLYRNVYFGLGANGIPDTSSKAFGGVPSGSTTVGAGLLSSLGFSTITNVLAGQITAGP